ncbi:hypothetical protein [Telluribacter sp.]|jgi:hypothetical protein|uniref:hypothetical protein n=1 Tax=Telluribacter sp. TaxID=1978767 RepID=UPI002E116340|nr:hypothetical protein [Telluribacter sp.]
MNLPDAPVPSNPKQRSRYRILYQLESWLEGPMFILALVWLWLFGKELLGSLSPLEEKLGVAIWILFIVEFLLKVFLAPRKGKYIRQNWLTLLALVIPAFRAFRLVNAIRVLRVSRVATTTRFVRALTSTKRFLTDLEEVQGPTPIPEVHVGLLVMHRASANRDDLLAFTEQLAQDVQPEITAATGIKWFFHFTDPAPMSGSDTRQPSDFLDEASLHMAEGPYDLIIVVTDVALISRKKHVEPALTSLVSRVSVISTRKLISSPRGKPVRKLASESVRWNAALLLLHVLGHLNGLDHKPRRKSPLMAPFIFREDLGTIPAFTKSERNKLHKRAGRFPERELRGGNWLDSLIFHVLAAFRHPMDIVRPLLRNWAIFLPLSLPGLATAAVAPSFVLIFTAEIWDAGLNMDMATVALYALISILVASYYLIRVQSLFLPRKEKKLLTEHLAVANTVIYLSVLLACIGLFLLVTGLMLLIVLYIFPESLMKTWPTLLDQPNIDTAAKIKLAAFISTFGVTTGALAGGLENRTLIRHLALFENKP